MAMCQSIYFILHLSFFLFKCVLFLFDKALNLLFFAKIRSTASPFKITSYNFFYSKTCKIIYIYIVVSISSIPFFPHSSEKYVLYVLDTNV